MIDQTTKSATPCIASIRDLALDELESVSGGGIVGFSVENQAAMALARQLKEAYLSHQKSVLGDAIENAFHPR